MREQNNKTDKQTFPVEIKLFLQEELVKTVNSIGNNKVLNELVQHCIKYREQKGLIYSTSLSGKQYLEGHWKHFYEQKNKQLIHYKLTQQKLPEDNQQQQRVYLPELSLYQLILQAATKRQHLIQNEIMNETLKIQKKTKPLKINKNPQQDKTTQIQAKQKQLNESNTSRNSQKDFFQFIKNEKLQKERRKKLLQKQLQKQKQQQKQKKLQEQKIRQQQHAQKQQEKRNRQKQLLQKRQKQKQLIKKHHSLYSQFQTKLFQLKQKQAQTSNLLNRFSTEQLRRIQSEKKQVYKSFQKPKIDEHQKLYLQSVNVRKQKRYKRFEEMKKIQEIQKQKSRIRYHSAYKFQRPQDEYERLKREQYQKAKQKRDRIMLYKNRVRSNHLPQVDQQKKNQLMRLVEQLQSSRKLKRKILKNGQKVIQKLQVKDHKQVGLNYLQNVKKQVQKMREFKRQMQQFRQDVTQFSNQQRSQQNKTSNNSNNNINKKPIDYLKQLRESHKPKTTSQSPFSTPRNTVFSNTKRSQMSFDQKLKRIQNISHKLMQKTKQQEMLLKYGKFKTPQQILDKKQMIDKNYIDMVNMKLKMIEDQYEKEDKKSQ